MTDIKVAIFGGGVAGMSAAHELAERGFKVEVYEKQSRYVGGKARSVDAENTGTDGRKDLPGEHGFRFFPGFYKHITDTMKRIPFASNPNGVFDNLVSTERVMLARFGKMPINSTVNFPKSREDVETIIQVIQKGAFGLSKENEKLFAEKMWQLLTSSYRRRQEVYERMSWWQYMETDRQCKGQQPCAYEEYCVGGLTHTLVAAQPKLMSTKTGGDILMQLMLLMANPAAHTDRVLNGPTNDKWLFPWLAYLRSMGVQYFHHHTAKEFICDTISGNITGVKVHCHKTGEEKIVVADYYISAMPVERISRLINKDMLLVDSTLGFMVDLSHKHSQSLNWMNGIQYFLDTDVQLTKGHVIFIDSPWAITAISQPQFWEGFDFSEYGNGKVKGILSVDVSNWFSKGLNGKTAKECTLEEIKDEVWQQMEKSLNVDGKVVIDKSMIVVAYIDSDIQGEKLDNGFTSNHNDEPLLVNTANSWSKRPEATTGINNFFLASDFVRTYTDLATMEGANEAARRAVNGIISKSGVSKPYCKIWKLHEPGVFAIIRWLDRRRYEKGLPWTNELPWLVKILHHIFYYLHKMYGFRNIYLRRIS
jgi:uncharacterized protein with NAD-binding domain and iron-sulfur cluster